MKLMVRAIDGQILAASNLGGWTPPDFAKVLDFPGDAESYAWPHANGASSCIYDAKLGIVANPAVPVAKSSAMGVVDQIKADPGALAALKAGLA